MACVEMCRLPSGLGLSQPTADVRELIDLMARTDGSADPDRKSREPTFDARPVQEEWTAAGPLASGRTRLALLELTFDQSGHVLE